MDADTAKQFALGFCGANENALVAYIYLHEHNEGRKITFKQAKKMAREVIEKLDQGKLK